ncbi:MAG TPA: FlgD immunoglobulin-like domain containing protein [Candidatus Eisenbacteria bacterium]|nr:FlgD immunoglobulin-like domain containing protein [Candidatus Eisenbacteria bacterium]
MKKAVAVLAVCVAILPSAARAAVTFEFIFDDGTLHAVSADGSVVTGNTQTSGNTTAFRWTQATGLVSLGRPMLVGGAGVPDISADGTRIAFGIGSLDGTYTTHGLWTFGSGWQELMPPPPADGGTQDGSYGSVWGLSGDGNTVVGLFNRPGQGNRAHASKWTQATGVVDLGGTTTGQASRANAVNYDGSVIGGWVETPQGPWRPAVWANGSLQLLTNYDPLTNEGIGEVRAANQTGDIITGFARSAVDSPRGVAKWTRVSGTFGDVEFLGWVDGTETTGLNVPYAVSNNGKVIVGYCTFDGSPFNTTGFIWTEATGVQDINTWLADNGVLVDPNFTIQSLGAMTPDGTQIFGHGQMLTPPYTRRAFRITVPPTVSVPEPRLHARLELSPPRPNPSTSSIRLDFALESAGPVDLSVYDASGRRVATLLHSELPAGRRSVSWDGREESGRPVGAGLYFARLITPQGSALRRIVRMH